MARRKDDNTNTNITIKWNSKKSLTKLAKLVKKTRNGEMYESDAVMFDNILNFYETHHEKEHETPKTTYPTKS